MAKDKMLCAISKAGLIDTPEGLNVWHDDIFEARAEGVRFCQQNDYPFFVVRTVDSYGHYKTLSYRDKNGNRIQ